MTTAVVEDLWREQSIWSQTANRMKKRIDAARWTALCLVVAVAACATASATLTAAPTWLARTLAAVAAAGAGALPLLRRFWSGERLKNWTRARSVSEALKTDVYLWLAKAGPFTDDPDGVELARRGAALRVDAADLLTHRAGIEPVTRSVPDVHDGRSYVDVRVEAQAAGYYEPRADGITRTLARLRAVEVTLGIAGLVLGVVAALTAVSLAAWVTVVATVGTALATHIAAARYEFQRIEFLRTGARLRELQTESHLPGVTAARLGEIAVEAENVISVENQGWMAKLAEEPGDHAAPKTGGTPPG